VNPRGWEDWLCSLPELERDRELDDELIEDVCVGDVPLEEGRAWRELGVRVGHA
jgi:hypothetical protein